MARDLSAGFITAITDQVVLVNLAAQFDFAGSTVRVWTGQGTLVWNAQNWTGVGDFGGVSPIEEGTDVSAKGITFTLSGVPPELISLALTDNYRGRSCYLWLLIMNAAGDTVLQSYQQFSGRMDSMSIEDAGETSTIRLSAESHLVDLERPRTTRYTDAEQQRLYAGDLGLEYVAALAEKPLYWGIANAPISTPAPGGGGSPTPPDFYLPD